MLPHTTLDADVLLIKADIEAENELVTLVAGRLAQLRQIELPGASVDEDDREIVGELHLALRLDPPGPVGKALDHRERMFGVGEREDTVLRGTLRATVERASDGGGGADVLDHPTLLTTAKGDLLIAY